MPCRRCRHAPNYGHCPPLPLTGPRCDRNWRTTPEAQVNDAVRTAPDARPHRPPLEAGLPIHYAL